MNILYVVPYVPNLIYIRSYSLIRYLSSQGHNVTLLTAWSKASDSYDLKALEGICSDIKAVHLSRWRSLWNCLVALPSRTPLQAVYCWHPEMARQMDDVVKYKNGQPPFDIVHVEHLRGARYGLHFRSHNSDIPLVWDSVDCISLLFRRTVESSKKIVSRWIARFDLSRTRKYEGRLLNQFDHVLITTQSDKEAISALAPQTKPPCPITVLHNGVDLEALEPDSYARREPDTLVITGKMSYHANISMVMHLVYEIMPIVWAHRPDVKLWVVGKDPTKDILALTENPRVTVTGMVPDVRPYLKKATVAVVPLVYGTGIQNKVLEAMACATPVVSTPHAMSALQAVAGQDVILANEPHDFAEQVIKLLDDPICQQRIGQAGHQYVVKYHRWEMIGSQLEGVYAETIRSKSGRSTRDSAKNEN